MTIMYVDLGIEVENLKRYGIFPTQWYGDLPDGRRFYARYRSGFLSYGIGKTDDDAIVDSFIEEHEFNDWTGDGMMSTAEMTELLGVKVLSVKSDKVEEGDENYRHIDGQIICK